MGEVRWGIDMELLSSIVAFLYQAGDAFAFLVLAASGLAIIFGMMGVINLAHGEFILCGAYVSTYAIKMGIPFVLAVIIGALVAGLLGIVLERLIVRHLYHRPLDTIVATWGISLIVTQTTLIVLGSTIQGTGTPLGSFRFGGYSYSEYRVVLMAITFALIVGLYCLFLYTRFGLLARATIQVPHMAQAMGVNTGVMYSLTFGVGAALAGLAGALYAPTMTLVPTMGSSFVVDAFVTVVVGGADIFLGTAPAAAILSVMKAGLTSWKGQMFGHIGMLLTVIVVIRVLPNGISGWILRQKG